MEHVAQNSFADDNLGHDDMDLIFSRLEQQNPPADFVQRLMQAVSRFAHPQMLQSDDEQTWDDEDPIVHPEHKQSS